MFECNSDIFFVAMWNFFNRKLVDQFLLTNTRNWPAAADGNRYLCRPNSSCVVEEFVKLFKSTFPLQIATKFDKVKLLYNMHYVYLEVTSWTFSLSCFISAKIPIFIFLLDRKSCMVFFGKKVWCCYFLPKKFGVVPTKSVLIHVTVF